MLVIWCVISVTANQQDINIGGMNIAAKNVWTLIGNTLIENDDKNWGNGYPVFQGNKNTCMDLKTTQNYKLRSNTCDQNFGYICEADP